MRREPLVAPARRRAGGLAGLVALGSTGTAAAHPLGNFTVNHYDGLRLFADRVELFAVVDYAEIPSCNSSRADADADGTVGPAEAAARAAAECAGGWPQEWPWRWTVRR